MTVNAITDTKKGRTGIAPTYLHTTPSLFTAVTHGRWIGGCLQQPVGGVTSTSTPALCGPVALYLLQ